MITFLFRILCCMAAVMILAASLPVFAKDQADIADLRANLQKDSLEVSFRLEKCFPPNMEEAIQNGVPITFKILVSLEKPALPLMRSPVTDLTFEHTIKYDRLNSEYHVQTPENSRRLLVTTDFAEAKRAMATVKDLAVIPVWQLKKEQQYFVKVKVELSKVELPLFLRYVFFFVALWDFETDWYKVSFTP
jgi:hypothetical protein